jgi:phospholipid/cholesterol/gamma-HCH transport system substrate-binding protein
MSWTHVFGRRWVIACLCAAALVVGGLVAAGTLHPGATRVTAFFSATKGLYPGDDVRILGVRVGTVDTITPQGTDVRVDFHVDRGTRVPADAAAVILAPTLVTARYVQLTPGYTGGPTMASGSVIPADRTAVPVEFDQTTQQLSRLAQSLGPTGANRDGALSRLLTVSANNLRGQGDNLHNTLVGLSQTMSLLSDKRDQIFGTVRNLQVFTSTLAASDQQIVEFGRRLADVSQLLDANRRQLGDALDQLDSATGNIDRFVRDNRGRLGETVDRLGDLSRVLAQQRPALEQILQIAPGTLSNLYNIYDPVGNSLTGAVGVANMQSPAEFVCSGLGSAASMSPQQAAQTCAKTIGPLLNLMKINYPPVGVNPVASDYPPARGGGR